MDARSAEDRTPLDRLSPAEREVLILLARGHTAKTIATGLGISVAAVNERLRGARRRTGAGSSRELARRLAQQNRDEFSEVVAGGAPGSRPGDPAPTGRWTTRRNVMFASAALASVIALSLAPQLAGQTPQAAPDRVGPGAELLTSLSSAPDPQQLRDRLHAEPRDESWATVMESGIRELYGRPPAATRSLDSLSVTCAATLCEVVGRTRSGATSADVMTMVGEVQSDELNASIERRLGLRIGSSSFTASNNPEGVAFVAYLERATGA